MAAPKIVLDLVERFQDNREAYKRDYGETETRREFLDPLFKALGWDIDNTAGHAEAYKDVIHEDSVKIGVTTKAPDYSFRVGGVRKFFLEAKKPAVNIKEDTDATYQLRRYGWSAKLPLSVLSNFGELAVYDCRVRPSQGDKSSAARLMYFACVDYEKHWDEIASVFSKEAVYKGSFDKYAAGKTRRGTAQVDDAFLAEIESWRDALARNIALRNETLTPAELNFAVQQTIDRIIFLRICEDRGIETYGRLRQLQNGEHTYGRMKQLFQDADDRYNSGLFHFRNEKGRGDPDALTLRLNIDDRTLKDILQHLYYPDSPYEFSVLPADILGQVYEQFLGKVIRLTAAGHAKVEDKPEVKKAGGVYYTPTYIVDFIVSETIGKLIRDATPEKVTKLRVVDPACGSGSFLIGAYQYLLDWHRDWYSDNDPEKYVKGRNPRVYRGLGGIWRLTTAERKRILLNNIYGVDIDPQAVEVTKLSLLLKVLEDESAETIGRNREMFHERALPDLDQNIKCGNSLVGTDFFAGRLALGDDETARINAFDWETEFPSIMKAKGFDAVIGNPPYVRQESLLHVKDYLERRFECFDGVADLYAYFMERALRLLKPGGRFSYIVSSSFLRTTYARPLRKVLRSLGAVERIVDFGGLPVFANAKDTYVCIPVFFKGPQAATVEVTRVPSLAITDISSYAKQNVFQISEARLTQEAWPLRSERETAVFEKLMRIGTPLGQYVNGRFFRGVTTGLNEAFVVDTATRDALIARHKSSKEILKPMLSGEDIRRYLVRRTNAWLIFARRGIDIDKYPAIKEHLMTRKAELTPKRSSSDRVGRKPGAYQWYEIQDDTAYWEIFEGPKIIFPDICKEPRFFLDHDGRYLGNTAYAIGADDPYLLAILNSRLFWFLIGNISIPFGVRAGKYRYRLISQYMEQVPIKVPDPKRKEQLAQREKLVALAERLVQQHAQVEGARTPQQKAALERQLNAANTDVDRMVYEIYGLTQQDISVVEASTGDIYGGED